MRIGTGVFREAIKAIEANRLGEEYAVEAVNCDLRTGAIVPINGAANCRQPCAVGGAVWCCRG